MEIWKEITWLDGYRGMLDVSNAARVRRRAYQYTCLGRWGFEHVARKPDKVISSYVEKNGYATVAVQVDGKRKKFQLHYLVARAFVPGYEPGLCVNHIDGNKTNNDPSNLEWVTRARNTQHAWETGLVDLRGDNNPCRKLSSGKVRIIRKMLSRGMTCGEISIVADVSTSLIELIAKGERWNSVA